jgi:hypothetical protein
VTLRMQTLVRVPVPRAARPPDAGCSLGAYMALPVSHYTLLPLPLGATLARVPATDSLFALTIPRVALFGLVVQPTIFVSVAVVPASDAARAGPCVLIEAADARVDGDWATRLGLNALFEIYGTTRFTFAEEGRDAGGDAITSVTDLRIGVDPPPPFSRIKTSILERVGDAVLGAVCAQLQRVFVRALAADYARWAVDAQYRADRAAWGEQQDADAAGGDGAALAAAAARAVE